MSSYLLMVWLDDEVDGGVGDTTDDDGNLNLWAVMNGNGCQEGEAPN